MTQIRSRRFIFQNSNGKKYKVLLNFYGTGSGTLINEGDNPATAGTRTALTIDAGTLAASRSYHVSRMTYAAIYNTGQTLNAVLNAS